MSHFFVVVMVPKGTTAFEESVGALLAPYDENTRVPEYERECSCKGSTAMLDARLSANEIHNLDKIRSDFHAKYGDEGSDALWKVTVKPYKDAYEQALSTHPLKDAFRLDCECKGTGIDKTTYNPKSKWDWWVIGGRWDAAITGGESKAKSVYDDEAHTIEPNVTSVERLLGWKDDEMPFAIVTPDGEWHQKGDMGWWGMVSNESDAWPAQARELFTKYSDCLGVGCDLHI